MRLKEYKLIFCPLRSDLKAWSDIITALQSLTRHELADLDLEVGYNGRMVAVMRVERWHEGHTDVLNVLVKANLIDAGYELGE